MPAKLPGPRIGESFKVLNYKSMKYLLEDFEQYGRASFRGAEAGRRMAIDALVHLMHRYTRNRGYVLTNEFTVTVDYTPKMMNKRYDYDIAYTMQFHLILCGVPYQEITAVEYDSENEKYIIRTKDVAFTFDVKREYMEREYVEATYDRTRREDVGEEAEGDMAVDEEEMSESEESGLRPLRSEGHPRVSRVARL